MEEKEENIFWRRRRRIEKEEEENIWRMKIFFSEEKEKEEIVWKRKIFFGGGEKEQRRKRTFRFHSLVMGGDEKFILKIQDEKSQYFCHRYECNSQ